MKDSSSIAGLAMQFVQYLVDCLPGVNAKCSPTQLFRALDDDAKDAALKSKTCSMP